MERFWAKVDKRGPDDCWEWKGGSTCKDGYSRGGITQRTLAKEYGMSQAQISNIVRREHWTGIPAERT